jgi:pimeloyl-ACP methyl ester carboxylesterase
VLSHAGVFAGWFKPLIVQMQHTNYQVISYHRVGYAGSSRVRGTVNLSQQAMHLRSLMEHLGVKRAHIVGHSSSANIALQLALDAPNIVHTLILLEPALKVVKSAQERVSSFAPVHDRYGNGDKAGAIDAFMRAVAGPDYRADLERALPGAFAQAVEDADTFLGQELPAVQEWSFTPEDANRIRQPACSHWREKSRCVGLEGTARNASHLVTKC